MDRTIQQLERKVDRQDPFAQYQRVVVTFGAADTDVDIAHQLKPATAESIEYIVLRRDKAGDVYHDTSATRIPWAEGLIRLRCETADAVVTLLLMVPRA